MKERRMLFCSMRKKCFSLLLAIFVVSGCSMARHAVPADRLARTRVCGMSDIRAFSGIPSDSFKQDFIHLLEQEEKGELLFFNFSSEQDFAILAISGGGAYGAYGAGLLSGWSQAGTRPEFKIVTGVSTGAMIAPFAFLGKAYDATIKEFYTKYSTKDLVSFRFPIINALVSTSPLKRLIDKYFNAELLQIIAAEHRKGRRLYVGTTDLDAQRLVIWDMGKIASADSPGTLELFRKIILASAAVPVAFPPVYLTSEVDGEFYDEMHVDGGVTAQVFFLFDVLQGLKKAASVKGIDVTRLRCKLYVIRNGYVDPRWEEVRDRLTAIAGRSIDTMIDSQGGGDLYRLYAFTQPHHVDFNLAYIPTSFISKPSEPFDPVEMARIFQFGFDEACQGYQWHKRPPSLDVVDE